MESQPKATKTEKAQDGEHMRPAGDGAEALSVARVCQGLVHLGGRDAQQPCGLLAPFRSLEAAAIEAGESVLAALLRQAQQGEEREQTQLTASTMKGSLSSSVLLLISSLRL